MRNISSLARVFGKILTDHTPAVLAGIAVGGVVSTAYLAAKAGARAETIIWDEQIDLNRELTFKEKLKYTWPTYVPAFLVGTATIACVVGSNRVSARRYAAIVTAYSIAETAAVEYKDKVAELLTPQKRQKVHDDIAGDHLAKDPVSESTVVFTGTGDVLCYDDFTGRYFTSSVETLRKAQNDINATVIHEMYASQNDFYRLVGLPNVGVGEEVGWRNDTLMDLIFSTKFADDGRPCVVIQYSVTPIRGYYKLGD